MYQHASSLPAGKQDPKFVKKPDIALKLIDRCLSRGEKPGVVLVDAGSGNNSTFLKQLELKKLKYIAGLAKNRKVVCQLLKLYQLLERLYLIDLLAGSMRTVTYLHYTTANLGLVWA